MDKNENLTLPVSAKLPLTHLELLQKYYLEVFNVEIINFFIKEEQKERKNRPNLFMQNEARPEETLEKTQNYQIAIWIKDNNKIIFKNRIIRFYFQSNKNKEWIKRHLNNEYFIEFIDFQVSQYCQKYMKDEKDFNNILQKNENFQKEYNDCKKYDLEVEKIINNL